MNLRARFDDALLRRLDSLRLRARRRARGGAGEHRSARAGAGIEPASHRAYAPGDDFRRIDWSAYRRFERLYVLDREEESDRPVTILVDRSASMRGKLEAACALAATLAWIALGEGDPVALGAFAGDRFDATPSRRGRGAFFELLRFLEGLSAEGETRLEDACRHARGLTVLVTDFLDPAPVRRALLRASRGDLALVHVFSPEEEAPPAGPRRLVDSETGEELEVVLDAAAREDYARAFAAWTADLEREARALGAALVRVRSDQPLEQATLLLLERGGILA